MAYSFETYYPNGVADTFAIPFPYLNKSHILVRVNNTVVGFTFVSDGVVKTNAVPPAGSTVIVQRLTPVDAVPVDFSNRGRLTERSLDLVVKFYLYVAQESREASSLVVLAEQADLQRRITQLESRLNRIRYDVGVYVRDTPFNGTEIVRVKVGQVVFLPINLVESVFTCKAGPVGRSAILTLLKNDVAIGTVTFADGATTPTISFPAAVSFTESDVFSISSDYPSNASGFFGVAALTRFFYAEIS